MRFKLLKITIWHDTLTQDITQQMSKQLKGTNALQTDGRTDGRTDPGGVTLQNKAHKNSNFRQAEAFFPPLFVIIILLDCHVCNVEPSWRLLPGGRKQSKEKKLLKRQSQTPDVKASGNHKVNKTKRNQEKRVVQDAGRSALSRCAQNVDSFYFLK